MPSINLIAARREQKRKLEANIRRLVLVVAMEFGGMVFLASALTVRLMTLRAHVDYLGNQNAALQPKVIETQQFEAEAAALQPKVAVLNEARNTTLYWYTAVQTLSACLPEHTWLSGIDTGGDPTPPPPTTPNPNGSPTPVAVASAGGTPTLTFSGMSASSNEIGMAMLNMNEHPNIASVTLGSVTDTKQGLADVMQFSMTVLLKPNTAEDTLTPGFDGLASSLPPGSPNAAPAQPAVISLVPNTPIASRGLQPAKETDHV